jgi:hypothetical protein
LAADGKAEPLYDELAVPLNSLRLAADGCKDFLVPAKFVLQASRLLCAGGNARTTKFAKL